MNKQAQLFFVQKFEVKLFLLHMKNALANGVQTATTVSQTVLFACGAGSALPHVETPVGALGDRQPAPVPAVHDARKGQRLVTSKDGHKRK